MFLYLRVMLDFTIMSVEETKKKHFCGVFVYATSTVPAQLTIDSKSI